VAYAAAFFVAIVGLKKWFLRFLYTLEKETKRNLKQREVK